MTLLIFWFWFVEIDLLLLFVPELTIVESDVFSELTNVDSLNAFLVLFDVIDWAYWRIKGKSAESNTS